MPYFMPERVEDQRHECRLEPNEETSKADLDNVMVQLIHVNFDSPNWEHQLEKIATKFDMNHRDEVTINPDKMPDYQKKLEIFFQEHMHCDAELRVIREGSGYFDVRSIDDRWIRIPVKRGDFVYLPPGIYHRFTPDLNEHIVAIRLFRSNPKWEAHNRGENTEQFEERQNYLKSIKSH